MPHTRRTCGLLAALLLFAAPRLVDGAQLGALISPGGLARAHASLEGAGNCMKCHTAGRQVTAEKCLSCHLPIAKRMEQKKGVHRGVSTDCVTCHVEHAGVDGELRPFDQRAFRHDVEAGFPLDGLHTALSGRCSACHTGRSFLTAKPACASCHKDTHEGKLGATCTTCHSTGVRFAEAVRTFDHGRTRFALTGAHRSVVCATCHKNRVYGGLRFAKCSDCHVNPHREPLGSTCATCHDTAAWRTTRIDHARTTFPLRGRHAEVACRACHVQSVAKVKPRSDTCAACHRDPHAGGFREDCSTCHTESGFAGGKFDHATTRFALTDKHVGLACAACHQATAAPAGARAAPRTVDFRGLQSDCASCHDDVHRGELGTACATCHSARTFTMTSFTHARPRAFFEGAHQPVRCDGCHRQRGGAALPGSQAPSIRTGFTSTPTACTGCHRDVHLGQLGPMCETCHAVASPKFAVVGFSHDKTRFPLNGQHARALCAACHKVETADFPAGRGTATRLAGIGTQCVTCHNDRHAGQLGTDCQSCHGTDTFVVSRYVHRNATALADFFTGRHMSARCVQCHKPLAPAESKAVSGAVAYRVSTTCTTCHTDPHRGSLGQKCEACHKP